MDIIITTFESRIKILSDHIDSIRQFVNNRIVLVVNGEKDTFISEEYRFLMRSSWVLDGKILIFVKGIIIKWEKKLIQLMFHH